MYPTRDKLILFDADGTTIDAFGAIALAFRRCGMDLGDFERFQKRRHLFKYLGGVKEFPLNLRHQFGKKNRRHLLDTLTQIYREEAALFPGIPDLLRDLLAAPDIRIGLVTRNITHDPLPTLVRLFARHGVDLDAFDYVAHLPLDNDKTYHFQTARERLGVNPARSYVCGDEHKDYVAAVAAGMYPFVVSYGFEEQRRLVKKHGIPEAVIVGSADELCQRVRHALDVGDSGAASVLPSPPAGRTPDALLASAA